MFQDITNVSDLIRVQAKKRPEKKSIVFSSKKVFGGYKYPSYNFMELNNRINQFCNKLSQLGVMPGHRVLYFVKPNLDFCAITFALFRMGATPVFIDPGMKKDYFFKSIRDVSPDVLIGIPKVHYMRHFYKAHFSSIKIFITTGKISGPFAKSVYGKLKKQSVEFDTFKPKDELAAILYTSGGTGVPKGVEYTHDIFISQTKMLKDEFKLTFEDCDIPGFPLFSFFTLAMGMTSVIPDMDASKPAQCDPAVLFKNINENKATFIAGSPAIWERLADHCLQNKLTLNSVKYVVMFGAPVSVNIHQKFEKILPNGTTFTPYGSTECLPMANVSGKFILGNVSKAILAGKGTCVGKPMQGVRVKVIKQTLSDINSISDIEEIPNGEIGEIIVNSPNVTKSYFKNEKANLASKITDGNKVWHRMGDVGFLDDHGLLWFCGRKKHVVDIDGKKFYPTQIEAIYNQHPKIKRSALIKNSKNNKPVLVIERYDQKEIIESMFLMDLKNLSQTHEHTKDIGEFYARYPFPVDIRHNIKIDRTSIQEKIMGEV